MTINFVTIEENNIFVLIKINLTPCENGKYSFSSSKVVEHTDTWAENNSKISFLLFFGYLLPIFSGYTWYITYTFVISILYVYILIYIIKTNL